MGKFFWDDQIPEQDLGGAVKFLNELSWNLSIHQRPKTKRLYAGEKLLFEASSDNELVAFIYGMAITLAVLPEDIITEIKKIASE